MIRLGKAMEIFHFRAGQQADQTDTSPEPNGRDRPVQRGRPADIDDVVGSAPVRPGEDGLLPIGSLAIVDTVVGAQLPRAFHFLVAARRYDDGGAVQLGELQREQGHTSGSLYDDDVSGLNPAFRHDRLPGGDRRAREGGGFLVRQMLRYPHQSVFVQDGVFGEHAVQRAAQQTVEPFLGRIAGNPALGERGADPVARPKAPHALSNGYDFPDAVGYRDERPLQVRIIKPADHAQIPGIERCRPHLDPHFPRSGFGNRTFNHGDPIQTESVAQNERLHNRTFLLGSFQPHHSTQAVNA